MTVEDLRAEIIRLKNDLIEATTQSEIDLGRISAFEDMLLYIDHPEESSEDLEEAAEKHALQCHSKKASVATLAASIYDFKAGANWKKEQLMKDVVLETTIIRNDDGCAEDGNYSSWLEYDNSEINKIPDWAEEGNKVKVIIIKEEMK